MFTAAKIEKKNWKLKNQFFTKNLLIFKINKLKWKNSQLLRSNFNQEKNFMKFQLFQLNTFALSRINLCQF